MARLPAQKRGSGRWENEARQGDEDHGRYRPPRSSCRRLRSKRFAPRSDAGGEDAGGQLHILRAEQADRRQGLRQRRVGREAGCGVRHRDDRTEPRQAEEDTGRPEVAALQEALEG